MELTDTLLITKVYETKEEWCKHIHEFVKDNDSTYMDAVIHYCEVNDIEIEHISKLVDGTIKEKIRHEAIQENLMQPIERLDFADEL